MEKRKRVFGFFSDFIPYYRQLPKITGSVTSAILAAKLEIQFEKRPEGFYKFLEPAPKNPLYKKGHSWTETLGFTREEFLEAFSQIGVSHKSKTDYDKAENKFNVVIKIPKYSIKKDNDGRLNGRIKIAEEEKEQQMYYCRYHDRQTGLTHYFRNNSRSMLKDALSVNPKVRKYGKSEPSELRKSEPSELRKSEPSELRKSEPSELLYNKVSVDISVDESVDISVDTAPENGAPSAVPILKDSKPERKQSEWQILFGTLAEVCALDIKIGKNAARVGKELRELIKATTPPTKELLLLHYGEANGSAEWNWYEHDWRGKNKAPTLNQVTETWGNWKIPKSRKNGHAEKQTGYNEQPIDLHEFTLKHFENANDQR